MKSTSTTAIDQSISQLPASMTQIGHPTEPVENRGLVSVIVPVYNIETYLNTCVDSILAQSYPFFELLLIDDGSSDASPEICDRYAESDQRVIVIHKQNAGPSAARNTGIEKAKGDFIVFVDSDDLIQEQMLEKMVYAVTKYQTDLAMCGYERFRNDWEQKFRISPYSLVIMQSILELASVYLKPATNMFGVSIWAKLYRTKIIRDNHIRFREDINYEEDCLFNLDYFRHVTTTAVLRDYFYFYRQMDSSLSKAYRKNSFAFLVNGYRSRCAFLEELGMMTTGAENIFMLVVKNTLIKIFYSDLPKREKLEEYSAVGAFEESRAVCEKTLISKSRLTRLLARAVIHNRPKAVHCILSLWSTVDRTKQFLKKIIRGIRKS